jgi:hypothetical protein
MDTARADSLFLFLILAAFFVGCRYPNRGGKVASGWSAFLQRWAYANNFMPACAGLAVLAGLGYSRLSKQVKSSFQRPRTILFKAGNLGLFLFQFAFLFYNPSAQLPTDQGRQAWERFITRLRDLPGETLVFNRGAGGQWAQARSYRLPWSENTTMNLSSRHFPSVLPPLRHKL